MRFTADGPSIPDELLLARDEGRVVFFCGAGVSRARANLPDFFGLARSVIDNLKVPDDHVVRLILKEAADIQDRIKVGGLISADRLFGWLERDFVRADIEAAVSQALLPPTDVDLSAHKTLLSLATTPQGRTQLVTTNFDRLFNDCDPTLQTLHPPNLPNFRLGSNLDGLVYLHGRAASDYSSAEGGGYVLSTSGFGRAYLSDAWATGFLKDIISRYVVVFVGYTADDPPVQYLLEALSQVGGRLDGVYAFQSGDQSEATAKWQYKGVTAIPYDDADKHRALWTTLEAWAQRAIDVDRWYRSTVDLARRGPYELMPHERGQVAHLLMTVEGTKRLCDVGNGVPTDWICVIDPAVRYSSIGRRFRHTGDEERVDPFEFLSLDGDEIPPREDPNEDFPQRKIPKGVWNGLLPTAEDRETTGTDGVAGLVNYHASNPSRLPPRLNLIGKWLAENADKPATFWWLARQRGIHPQLELRIRRTLETDATTTTLKARQAWRDLFTSWSRKKARDRADRFDLERQLQKDGWSAAAAIEFGELLRPFKEITVEHLADPLPPSDDILDPDNIVSADVSYVEDIPTINIPDAFLRHVARELRYNLEVACDLEQSLGGFGLDYLAPLVPQREDDGHRRLSELNGLFFRYLQIVERLSDVDVGLAKNEVACWPNEDTIFARLRIWAIKRPGLLSTEEQGAYLMGMSDVAFWSSNHQRDLMLALSDRWRELPESARFDIERRLLRGRPLDDDDDIQFAVGQQIAPALERLVWMRDTGLALSPGTLSGIAKLRARLPDWKPEYARHALDSTEVQVYSVETDTEHAGLVDVPSKILLARATEDARRSEDRRTQYDPFQGLCASRPLKALSALTTAARDGEFPAWAWRSFLNSESRKDDDLSLKEIIARRIVQYSDQLLAQNMRELAEWQLSAVKDLPVECSQLSDTLFGSLVATIQNDPRSFGSSVSKSKGQRDWAMEALNSPVGKLAQSLFRDPRVAHVDRGRGFDRRWLESVEALLAIPGSHRRYALTMFSHHLGWFYHVDPAWTKQALLSVLVGGDHDDRMAFWAGFLWGGRKPETALYRILQPHLLAIARDKAFEKRGYNQVMAGLILSAWGTPAAPGETALVSDAELRDLILEAGEDFRRTLLWQGEQFAKREEDPTGSGDGWWGRLLHLFQDVWPRQFSVRTPAVTSRLCDIAFSSGSRFPKFVQAVLPVVSVIDGDQIFLPTLRQSTPTVVEAFPQQTLDLLYPVLPSNANLWPYGIEDVLKSLASADGLAGDQRLLELRRRLDKR